MKVRKNFEHILSRTKPCLRGYSTIRCLGKCEGMELLTVSRKRRVLYSLMMACCILIISLTKLLDKDIIIPAVKIERSLNYIDEKFTTTFLDVRHNWEKNFNQSLVLYLLSAIGSYTTKYVDYQRDIKVIGWMGAKHKNARLKCCFLLKNRTISEFYNPTSTGLERSTLIASQIACPINSLSDIAGVDIQSAALNCSTDENIYLKPHLPEKNVGEDSFAVCLKLVYGNVDNKLFIDWIEYYREMKVDKIFMFTYNLTTTTNSVIDHYVQLGLVERHPYDYPLQSKRRIGQKMIPYYEDERVLLLDCLQRSSVYKYLSVVDMDEFILPRKHNNLKELMKHLMQLHPKAAGFNMKSYLFVKDVGPDISAPINGSDIVKYFVRTDALKWGARKKNIILPLRINSTGFGTHRFRPSEGYESVNASTSVVATSHYRICYDNIESLCSKSLQKDKYILRFVEKFKNRRWYPDE